MKEIAYFFLIVYFLAGLFFGYAWIKAVQKVNGKFDVTDVTEYFEVAFTVFFWPIQLLL